MIEKLTAMIINLPVIDLLITLGLLLKIEIPYGKIIGISYSQQIIPKMKGYGDVKIKRLLVFSQDKIYMNALFEDDDIFSNGYSIGLESETIIHGSFVCKHKPKHFIALISCFDRYFVRTYTIQQTNLTKTHDDKKKKALMKCLKNFNANLYKKLANKQVSKYVDNYNTYGYSIDSYCEIGHIIKQKQTKELEKFQGQKLVYIRTIMNITPGQTELIVTTESLLGSIIINKKAILSIIVQEVKGKILEIEYWNGYYFVLYENNTMGIYKRGITGCLDEVQVKALELNELKNNIKLTRLKLPMLEWSGKLSDILHKDISSTIVLIGTCYDENCIKNYIIKYNIYTNRYLGYAIVNSVDEITSINYGPYDNGPIIVGLSNGVIKIYDYYTLALIKEINKIIDGRIQWISCEPGNALLVASAKAVYKLVQF